MTPDALPVTRNGITRWESPAAIAEAEGVLAISHPDPRVVVDTAEQVFAALDRLDHFDHCDPLMAALGVLDVKLAVVIADQERLLRLLERVAGVVDVRLVTP